MVVTYKCPQCGAVMEFDGQSGKLHCDSCGAAMSVEEYKREYGETAGDDTDPEADGPLGEDS